MPRSNRPRGRKAARGGSFDDGLDVERLTFGWRHTESKRGVSYTVQPISAANARKSYVCPGCGREVAPGSEHVAVWRADGLFGDEAALADRRHWHAHCWKIA
jgi:hypothetical protein